MTSSNYKMNMKGWNFLQFLGPLPMIIQLGVHFDTQLHVQKRNILPSPKKPQQNNKSSVIHIFSHIYLSKVQKNQTPELAILNSRTVGTEVPKRRYRSPERSLIPTPETSRSRIVGLPSRIPQFHFQQLRLVSFYIGTPTFQL